MMNTNNNNNTSSLGTSSTDMTTCNNQNYNTTNDTVIEHTETSSSIIPNVLFGTLNQEIADHFDHVMKVQLTKALYNTLPNLDGTTMNHTKLHDFIFQHYRKASDFIELYGIRNIFSLHMYNTNKSMQETIYNLYQQYCVETNTNDRTWDESEWICYDENDDESMSLKKKKSTELNGTITNMNKDNIDIVLPIEINHIPTTNDVQILTNDITTLNVTLQQLQNQYQSLYQEVNVLHQLHDTTTSTSTKENLIQSSYEMTNTITNHIHHTIPIIQTLHNYTNTSNQLQQYMNTIQNERTTKNNNNNEKSNIPMDMIIDPITIVPSKKKKQQLQNNSSNNIYTRYEQDILQQNGTTSITLHNMIHTIQPK